MAELVQDLTAAQLRTLLVTEVNSLTDSQAVVLEDFIERIGGVENAWTAVNMLSEFEDAA